MFHDVPVGYVLDENGLPQFDPDDSARRVVAQFFELFERLGSVNAVRHYMFEHDIKFPFRPRRNKLQSIDWRLPSGNGLQELLKHPLYAGAYGYGRRKKYGKKATKSSDSKLLPPEQWKVLIKDRHPAYITWEQYLRNQERLKLNYQKAGFCGIPREGSALLAGLLRCGNCGYRMCLVYPQNANAYYTCYSHTRKIGGARCCTSIRCDILDNLVVSKILEALSPAGIELSMRVIEDEEQRRKQLDQLYVDRISKAQYAVDLAQRRYQHVDPANRLVASRLEKEWESALTLLNVTTKELTELRSRQSTILDAQERTRLQESASDITQLWNMRATIKDRKELSRLLLETVEMRIQGRSEHVDVRMVWRGGFESCHQIVRTVGTMSQWDGYEETVKKILRMMLDGLLTRDIAIKLNEEGLVSPRLRKPFTGNMIRVMIRKSPWCQEQLDTPKLGEYHWRADDLLAKLGIRKERLQRWVANDWLKVIQRPYGRTWVIWADEAELKRLHELALLHENKGQT